MLMHKMNTRATLASSTRVGTLPTGKVQGGKDVPTNKDNQPCLGDMNKLLKGILALLKTQTLNEFASVHEWYFYLARPLNSNLVSQSSVVFVLEPNPV